MENSQTICHKITLSIEDVEKAIKTGNLDVITLAKRLHSIREDAQKMENALKLRKEIMIKAELEEIYKEKKELKAKPEGINKIMNEPEQQIVEKINFEVTIKRDGEVIYQSKAHAGALSIVEKIEDIDEFGTIDGRTQRFHFGPILAIWFAFDQMKQSIEARGVEIMGAIKKAMSEKKVISTEAKKKLQEMANL